ncbi:MAG: hypothetical protein ACI9W1_000727 [Candidatus Azotimanducaceae bacterium]
MKKNNIKINSTLKNTTSTAISTTVSTTVSTTISTTIRTTDIMDYAFPNVDTLMEIAKKNPSELDRIKQEAVSALIESADKSHQQRLRGLQWQVDMELNKSKSPMEGCIKISGMMHEKLWELRGALQSGEQRELEAFYESDMEKTTPMDEIDQGAVILPFRS